MATSEVKINIQKAGKFIADYRNSKAWSQAQIAKKLGVSRVTVVRWENGEAKPSVLAIKQFEKMVQEDPGVIENVSFNSQAGKNQKTVPFIHQNKHKKITTSPYVINGPKDQNNFHKKLIEMQGLKNIGLNETNLRLKMLN